MGTNFIKNFFNKFFWRQHPEAALRYLPVVSEINKANLQDTKILEVGSGSLGIIPYLKKPIDGLDIDFTGPQTKLLNKIKGDATKIPFRKNSYDLVISVDTLEHLKKEKRINAICEILRVAKKMAIIVVPIGELSEKQDFSLEKHWQGVFNQDNIFLEEHIENGLPTTEEILVAIDKISRKINKVVRVRSYPNLNLKVRSILMKTWITKNNFLYALYMKGYLLLLPFLKFANFGNCYRRVFVIEFVPKTED